MAEPSREGMLSEGDELIRRARALAGVLDIPVLTFTARERQAYQVLAHPASMPVTSEHGQRHRYGNEVLANANKLMPYSDPSNGAFFLKLDGLVATMQEFPAWYAVLTDSNEDLVNSYNVGGT